MSGVAGAAVDQGGNIVGQLDGGDLGALLTDGHGEDVALVPGAAQRFGKFRTGHHAGLLSEFDAGLLSQTKHGGILIQQIDAYQTAYFIEVIVAGVHNSLAYILQAVGASILPVVPALRLRTGVERIDTFVIDQGIRFYNICLQGTNGGNHLEGRAGRIQTLESTVQQGFQGIFRQVVVVLGEGSQRIGGVRGGGQHIAGVYVQHYAGRALRLFTLQAGYAAGQNLLHLLLQVNVNGEEDVLAGLRGKAFSGFRVGEPLRGDDLTALIALDGTGT